MLETLKVITLDAKEGLADCDDDPAGRASDVRDPIEGEVRIMDGGPEECPRVS